MPSTQRRIFSLSTSESPSLLREAAVQVGPRFNTGIRELDRVLGGGLVPGSLILVGGEPGIGKSTLLLQASHSLSKNMGTVLYISGEESVPQTRLRAQRLGTLGEQLYVVCETNLETVLKYIDQLQPKAVIIDSIQTMYRNDLPSAPGSVSQVRECAAQLMQLAKGKGICIFLVGHVTKDGSIAGPRVLEHIVDTVLYFEGDQHHFYRVLRAVKNRFGSTNEIGIFEMQEKGLIEVENPSQIFLAERPLSVPGSVVVSCLEGTRPLLVELQALVSPTSFPVPQRRSMGVDYNRVVLIIAVLEKRLSLHLQNQDVFVNAVGGVKVMEPATDLGIALAIFSSYHDRVLDPRIAVTGEVGLAGEIRAVNQIEGRLREVANMGFEKFLLPMSNLQQRNLVSEIKMVGVSSLQQAFSEVMEK